MNLIWGFAVILIFVSGGVAGALDLKPQIDFKPNFDFPEVKQVPQNESTTEYETSIDVPSFPTTKYVSPLRRDLDISHENLDPHRGKNLNSMTN